MPAAYAECEAGIHSRRFDDQYAVDVQAAVDSPTEVKLALMGVRRNSLPRT